ncbi:dihydroorotase [Thermogymnomonas acidicola]|uniref:Dihydroorotase n=1 Tax=Thermogymnomonas acidicola TaxID=399579 RepID=A0AA37BTK6_9ARCH|nr:dihydroorotase [Thermogymnomonas acidicola]GGM78713.1 dihydroorotase [Thermogymnomonas acidicola]
MQETVYSGIFYYLGEFRELEVLVRDGRIERVGMDIRGFPVKRLPGAVLPAGTDIHVHFRDPGETEKEDFETGSLSAIYGGTTTVFDMPNNAVPVDNYEVFREKLARVRGRSYADFGLYTMFTGSNEEVISRETSGIKVFMGGSTNSVVVPEIDERKARALDSFNVPVAFHAEDQGCLAAHQVEARDTREYNRSRPLECEVAAGKAVDSLKIRKRVVAHMTYPYLSAESSVVREVTPHHLLLHDSMGLGPLGKVNPPLRDKPTVEANLEAYLRGYYTVLSSDHAPHTQEDKEEFEYARAGIVGVETRIPLMLALVKKKVLDMKVLIETACSNPAEVMGIRKGRIDVGYYADFMCVDLNSMRRVNEERLHSKNPWTPFNGFDAVFPETVIMRGQTVLDRYEAIEEPLGEFVRDLK